jgi:hypothetical protein
MFTVEFVLMEVIHEKLPGMKEVLNHLHSLSRDTAAGDRIGWEFE